MAIKALGQSITHRKGFNLRSRQNARSLFSETSILPLVIFRITFGLMLFAGTVRFALKGWIHDFYIAPQFHFTYYGFDWIRPLPPPGIYLVFILMGLCALGVMLGLYYRLSILSFFLLFTYVELIDKSYYLNHYYLVSLLTFLLIFLPAQHNFSLDAWRNPSLKTTTVATWTLWALRLQVGIVYFYAGLAKLKTDWLLHALPLKLWLPARVDFPLIGFLFDYEWMAYGMSWGGAIFDLSIPFLLLWRRTRPLAFLLIILFHGMTWLLFPIGIFPWLMICAALLFFSAEEWELYRHITRILTQKSPVPHLKEQRWDRTFLGSYNLQIPFLTRHFDRAQRKRREDAKKREEPHKTAQAISDSPNQKRCQRTIYNSPFTIHHLQFLFITLFFTLQLLLPLRHYLYPGNVLWTEEGFRFAWHVMVYEKTGYAIFHITEPQSGRKLTIFPSDILTSKQQEQMAIQPDMIAQFGRDLARRYADPLGVESDLLDVRAEAYVSLNGRSSRLLIDPTVNLTKVKNDSWPKEWIIDGP